MSTDPADTDFIPPELDEIGALLPNYEMLSFIAKGGMGAVYLARQTSLDREVAIKILPRHFGEDEEFRASFQAEAKSMAKLNHPNLVGIYDFGQVDGMLYIIMEMVHGKSLYHSAYGQTIDPAEAGRIVCEICHGLANAHKHGILHRDIKPANILLDPHASPKIGDFGLARPVGDHESDSAFGTPGYTAPEVVHNPEAVDESTDLYSVGAILYELLTSKLPETPYMPAANLVQCDPRFDDIIRKAMNPNPVLRYRSAESMAEAIDEIINDKNKSSASNRLITAAAPAAGKAPAPRSTPPPVVRTSSKGPFLRNIIIIIILLAAIYGAWNYYTQSKSKREAENQLIIEQNEQKKEKAKALLREKRDAVQSSSNQSRKTTTKSAEPQQINRTIPDQDAPRKPKATVKCEELEEIREKCVNLTSKIKSEHDKKFLDNIKGYEQDIEFYLRGLPKNKQAAIAAPMEKMQSLYTDNKIPDNFAKQGMPDKVVRIYESRLRIQGNIEKNFLEEIEKLRGYYRKNLVEIKDELADKGLGRQVRLVGREIDATDVSGQGFVDYILDDY